MPWRTATVRVGPTRLAREIFAEPAVHNLEDPDVFVNLAIATLNRQHSDDPELALEIPDTAPEYEPGHLRALYCRRLIPLHIGNAEPALECFQRALAVDPSDVDTLGILYTFESRF